MLVVVLAIAALAILACVVLVSLGRGGELTEFPPDVPPLDLPEPGQLTAVDFMALQLPVNLVGYHTQSVDETLRRAASAISARDTRIAVLEQRVSELLSSRLHARQEVYAAPGNGPRTEHEPEAPVRPALPEEGDQVYAPPSFGRNDQPEVRQAATHPYEALTSKPGPAEEPESPPAVEPVEARQDEARQDEADQAEVFEGEAFEGEVRKAEDLEGEPEHVEADEPQGEQVRVEEPAARDEDEEAVRVSWGKDEGERQ
ncbi:hypothetical protein [Nonomuraea sediminis]|uniref:hypothetical protein n=1 Tax=Nonomuraea sediminis TaxID=2835864 RepID=UPI001BDDB573|nr:hypothetical protein [Nonomuraea sediminis]